MKGKTKLDGTTVHISDLPHIPQRRYTYKLDKNLASTSILPQLLLMNPPYKHVTSSAKDKEVLMVADNGSVRADEMPRGSTDPDDDNLWRRYGSSWCAIIQGLLPNADIHAHANNDLLWSYATGGEGGIDENNRERSSGESSGEEIKGAWYEAYQLTAAIQAKMSKEAAKALSEETQAAEIHA